MSCPFENVYELYRLLLWPCLIFLAITICICLFRAILGPRFTDRIVAVNIICTKTIIIIAILSFLTGDTHLIDIAIVYAMISFLAIVVLSKCYMLPHSRNIADPEPWRLNPEEEETT